MEMEVVQTLITAFKEAELTSLSLKCEAFELKLGKEVTVNQVMMPNLADGTHISEVAIAQAGLSRTVESAPSVESTSVEDLDAKKYIKSPIVGTFYHSSSPQAAPFVTVGSKVKKGDVVCVIEAMKLMNEVEAEEEGEIVEILIQNEDMVEYGQPLFVFK